MADQAHSVGNPARNSSVPIIRRTDSNRDDTTPQSLIAALHQRYENADAEYQAIERAEMEAEKGSREEAYFQKASDASVREIDALRVAILHQVPRDPVDAMILQFHILNTHDLQTNNEGPPKTEGEALATAIDTLFDYLCCSTAKNPAEIGRVFMDGAIRAHDLRRYRTGQVEG